MATALVLMQETAKAAGLYLNGTATAGGNSTLTDAARRQEETDMLVGAYAMTTSGTNNGSANARRVSANVQSSGIVTIVGTWTTNPANNVTYDIYLPPFHPVKHYLPALSMALQEHFLGKPVYRQTRVRVPRQTSRLTVPSSYRRVVDVLRQGSSELLTNDDWYDGSTGWTLGASHVLANTGDDQDRVLSVPNTNETTQDVSVTGGVEYDFAMEAEDNGTVGTRMIVRWLDADAQIGSDVTIGTVTATTKTRVESRQRAPVNADEVRVVLEANGAGGAGKVYWSSVSAVYPWAGLRGWEVRRDGGTRYLELPHLVGHSYDLLLRGEGVEASLTADTDSVTLDDNELRYLCALALAKAYMMLPADGVLGQKAALDLADGWMQRAREIRRENANLTSVVLGRPAMTGY